MVERHRDNRRPNDNDLYAITVMPVLRDPQQLRQFTEPVVTGRKTRVAMYRENHDRQPERDRPSNCSTRTAQDNGVRSDLTNAGVNVGNEIRGNKLMAPVMKYRTRQSTGRVNAS